MYPLKTIVKAFRNKNSTKHNLRESSLTFSQPQVSPPPQNNLQKTLKDFPLQSMLKKPASVLHQNWSVLPFSRVPSFSWRWWGGRRREWRTSRSVCRNREAAEVPRSGSDDAATRSGVRKVGVTKQISRTQDSTTQKNKRIYIRTVKVALCDY